MNTVHLIGRIGQDPQLRYTPSGTAEVKFSLATSKTFRTKDGEKLKETEWHNIVMFGKRAEIINQYCKKGSQLMLTGEIKYRSWEHEGKKYYRTEINCNEFEFLSSKQENSTSTQSGSDQPTYKEPAQNKSDDFMPDDDLPF